MPHSAYPLTSRCTLRLFSSFVKSTGHLYQCWSEYLFSLILCLYQEVEILVRKVFLSPNADLHEQAFGDLLKLWVPKEKCRTVGFSSPGDRIQSFLPDSQKGH